MCHNENFLIGYISEMKPSPRAHKKYQINLAVHLQMTSEQFCSMNKSPMTTYY